MCGEQKFFVCKHCGNLVGMVNDAGVEIICCGEPMNELIANTADASVEKHLPIITLSGNSLTVDVGSVEHPMLPEHHIEWVYIQTKNGGQRKCLDIGNKPQAEFLLVKDEVIAVFAYCNLHGLWKTDYK